MPPHSGSSCHPQLPWKSLASIVQFYYMWKTTDRYIQQVRAEAGAQALLSALLSSHSVFLSAEKAESGRGRQQAEAGLHPHLVSERGREAAASTASAPQRGCFLLGRAVWLLL